MAEDLGIYHLHALSPVHIGAGQGIGAIDQPVVREVASRLPECPGSGTKGVLRELLSNGSNQQQEEALFGPPPGSGQPFFKGALDLGDAKLLCLPVRSFKGCFAWLTCPLVLYRYARDLRDTVDLDLPDIPDLDQGEALTAVGCKLAQGGTVYLEDHDLIQRTGEISHTGWSEIIQQSVFRGDNRGKDIFAARFAIVHDLVFDWLSQTAMEVRSRIHLNDISRTTDNLWFEESIPAESILWGIRALNGPYHPDPKVREKGLEPLKQLLAGRRRIQIGGSATVGRGQVYWLDGSEEDTSCD